MPGAGEESLKFEDSPIADEVETLRGFSRGDAEASRRFVASFGGVLRRMAYVLSAEPEDAYQNALVAISRGAGTFDASRAPGGVRPWVLAVGRNTMRRRPAGVVDAGVGEGARPFATASTFAGGGVARDGGPTSTRAQELSVDEALAIREAFANLRSEDRDVLLLRDVEEFPASEAAEVLNITVDALKSRLHRARLRLASALGDAAPTVRSECRDVGGMLCTDVVSALPALLDGDAPAELTASAMTHLRGCTVCETFGGRYRSRIVRLRHAMGIARGTSEP